MLPLTCSARSPESHLNMYITFTLKYPAVREAAAGSVVQVQPLGMRELTDFSSWPDARQDVPRMVARASDPFHFFYNATITVCPRISFTVG